MFFLCLAPWKVRLAHDALHIGYRPHNALSINLTDADSYINEMIVRPIIIGLYCCDTWGNTCDNSNLAQSSYIHGYIEFNFRDVK